MIALSRAIASRRPARHRRGAARGRARGHAAEAPSGPNDVDGIMADTSYQAYCMTDMTPSLMNTVVIYVIRLRASNEFNLLLVLVVVNYLLTSFHYGKLSMYAHSDCSQCR